MANGISYTDQLDHLIRVIDKMGFNDLGDVKVPGTTEAIVIELRELNDHMESIANYLAAISDAVEV